MVGLIDATVNKCMSVQNSRRCKSEAAAFDKGGRLFLNWRTPTYLGGRLFLK